MKKYISILLALPILVTFPSCSGNSNKDSNRKDSGVVEQQSLVLDKTFENDYFSCKYLSEWEITEKSDRKVRFTITEDTYIICYSMGPKEEYAGLSNSEYISRYKESDFDVFQNNNEIEFFNFTDSSGDTEQFMCLSDPWIIKFEFYNFLEENKDIITIFMNQIKIKEQRTTPEKTTEEKTEAKTEKPTEEKTEPTTEKPTETPTVEATTEAPANPPTEAATDSNISAGKKNALKSAKNYIKYSGFSYQGLIEQLEYEKYTHEEAVYGADNCGADWNAEALESAKSYIDYSGFSYTGLIKQLEYEKFTHDQAVYGADNCGADWNEEAAESAQSYMEYMSMSREELIDQLLYEGFTQDQAEYGAKSVGY